MYFSIGEDGGKPFLFRHYASDIKNDNHLVNFIPIAITRSHFSKQHFKCCNVDGGGGVGKDVAAGQGLAHEASRRYPLV